MSTLTQFFSGGGGGDNTTKLTLTANENITAGDVVVLRSDGKIERTNKTPPNLSSLLVDATDPPFSIFNRIASKTNGTVSVAVNATSLNNARLLITLTSPTNPQYPENAPNPLALVSFPSSVALDLGDVRSNFLTYVDAQSIQYMPSQDVFVVIGNYQKDMGGGVIEEKGWAIAFTVNESTGAVSFGSASKIGQGHSYSDYEEFPGYMYPHPTLTTQMYYNQYIYDLSANVRRVGLSRFTVSGTTITRVVDFDTSSTGYSSVNPTLSPLALKSNRAVFSFQVAGSYDDLMTSTVSINSSTGDISNDLSETFRTSITSNQSGGAMVYDSTYDVFFFVGKPGSSASTIYRLILSGSDGTTANLSATSTNYLPISFAVDDVTQKIYMTDTYDNTLKQFSVTSTSGQSQTELPLPFSDNASIDANDDLIFYIYDDGGTPQVRHGDINAISNWTQYIGVAEEDITSGNSGTIVFNGGIASIPTQAEGTKVNLYTSYDGSVSTSAAGTTVGTRAGKDFVITNVY